MKKNFEISMESLYCFSPTMWAPKIAKLVHITPITMVYGTYNELVTGANLNQLSYLGGPTLKQMNKHVIPYVVQPSPSQDE